MHIDITVIPPIDEADWQRAERIWRTAFKRVPVGTCPERTCSSCGCRCIGTTDALRYAQNHPTRFMCPACARTMHLETPNMLHIHRIIPQEE